ncbi:transcriptional regulator [uncultured Pseudomonas sp.]|uniref:helix-turn-helix domain-containing protein n=1 Tax=Pseudomonas sp. 18175 TaxID=3390056 RepID=UPI0028D09060|nr:transcriptional regulator [uncultured Pseudomonas sp.]
MQLRIALAGAIRALRLQRQLRHEDLSDASAKSKLSALERGETSITLEKFENLAEGLRIDPLALLALCLSKRLNTPYPALMETALKQLRAFEKEGGLGILAEQFPDGEVCRRKPGKPQNRVSENVVRELKAAGMNQSQIARETGLALSTVHRYWKRINATDTEANG